MIGVTPDGKRQDHDARREVSDLRDDGATCLLGVVQVRIRKPGIPAFYYAQDFRRSLGLGGPQRGTASRAALTGREIQDAGAVAGLGGLRQGTGAGQLHVVAMGGDSQNVYGHGEAIYLLMTERFDRVHPCRAVSRVEPERQADPDVDGAGESSTPDRHAGLELEGRLEHLAGQESDRDTEQPTDKGEGRGLDQELPEDFPSGGAEGLA